MEAASSWTCLAISCLPSFSPLTTSMNRSMCFFRFRTFTIPAILYKKRNAHLNCSSKVPDDKAFVIPEIPVNGQLRLPGYLRVQCAIKVQLHSDPEFTSQVPAERKLETQLSPDGITFTNPSVTLNLPGVEWICLGINDKDRPPSLHLLPTHRPFTVLQPRSPASSDTG
ncbi:hypothetical protein EYF80_009487 [Liparis tanakae]|uniref:Uncharacterized protein n=1 Tax=Liparis tanakae TaxID=230148 RepID=A0A4Z2ISA4_9TELE|nr:hypothetical protein EYF80_009487 [Liparis tanakae]